MPPESYPKEPFEQPESHEPDQGLEQADHLIELAKLEAELRAWQEDLAQLALSFQRGEIKSQLYQERLEYPGTMISITSRKIQRLQEIINNEGRPLSPSEKIGRFITRLRSYGE